MNPDFSGLFGSSAPTAPAPSRSVSFNVSGSSSSDPFSNLFDDELKRQQQLNQAKQQEQAQVKQTAPIKQPTSRGFLGSIGHGLNVAARDTVGAAEATGRGVARAGKAVARPVVDIATGQGGKAAHDTAQLSSDVSGGTVNQFAKAIQNTPAAISREIQNKPITDIQKRTFGTTNPVDIAKKIVGSTVGTGSLFVGGGAVKDVAVQGAKAAAKDLAVQGAKNAAIGGTGTAAATITQNPKASVKDIAKNAAIGAAAGAVLPAAGKVVSKGVATAVKGVKNLPGVATKVAQSAAKADAKLGETGAIKPGAALKDAQDLIQKHQQSVKFTGDINRFANSSEGAKNNLLNDSAKLIKNRTQLTNEEKTQLQALRDARATKQALPQVSDKVMQADKEATDFAKATIKNDAERFKLEGNLQKAKAVLQRDPESYTHRVAQGKGSAFDYVLQNDRKNPLSVNFGKTTPADKTRTMFAAVDENGNRRVISIKSQTGKAPNGQKINRPNQITAFENGKPTETLGNLKTKAGAIGKQFVGKDGKTYTIDNATADEITKASGQKYFTDPALTNHAAYLDSRVALENARMFDAIKKAPESKTFMVEPGETAPKGYKAVPGVAQFQGYKFEPRAAEAITDLFGAREPAVLNKASQALRQTIVYFPLKHDLNMTAAYAMDRGLTSLANPLAYKRMFQSWGQAFNDIRTKSDFYQTVSKKGFGLTTNDKTAFENTFKKELQKLTPEKVQVIAKLAKVNPVNLYKAVQRLTVWDVQDFLNLARIHENMAPGLLKKGMSMEDAIKATEKQSFQYKVPSRVAGSRTASKALRSPVIFFGAYKYDQYKMVANAIKGMANVTKPGQALKNADKLAALAVGALVLWPQVNKGIQGLTGNKNAHITAPGPFAIPEAISKVRSGQQTIGQAAGNQVSVGPLQQILDLKSNTDSFTGKKIADPNASEGQQMQQRLSWLKSQLAPVQKISGTKNAGPGKQTIATILSLAGATMPKNSTQTTKLDSLKYDSLPTAQSNYKAAVESGNMAKANQIKNQYNQEVLQAAKAAIKASGKPVPSDQRLLFDLKKGFYLFTVSNKTVKGYQNPKKQSQTTVDKLLRIRP